jgi:hypothetical protein
MKALLLLFFVLTANGQTVGLHLVTAHSHSGLNGVNPGIYARFDNGVTVGSYRNSFNRNSVYAAYTVETHVSPSISVALALGAVTGYQRQYFEGECYDGTHSGPHRICHRGNDSKITALVAPSVAFHSGANAIRIALIPSKEGGGAAHLMFERRFTK